MYSMRGVVIMMIEIHKNDCGLMLIGENLILDLELIRENTWESNYGLMT